MKKFLAIILTLTAFFYFAACSNNIPDIKDNPLSGETIKLLSFDYGDVTLSDGLLKECYDGAMDYYINIPVDDMLYGMRSQAGINTKGGKDLGGFGIGGNVMGQWIQGNARYYAAVRDEDALERVTALCDGLYEISNVSPLFFDGQYMYSFEKYLRGCLDLYNLCGLEKGLTMAKRMVDTVMGMDGYQNAEKKLGNNGPGLEIEWYTIGETLYNFAETARQAGYPYYDVKTYRDFAASFEYSEFWDIFFNNENLFDYTPETGQNTNFFHAYSHLNTFNSAAAAYSLKKSDYYFKAIENFYSWMRSEQELATGGYGAHVEWLLPKEDIIEAIQNHTDSFETQCDTYAAYRLSNYMLNFTANAKYGHWSEKLLYNSTIASLETEDGYAFYYSNYNTDGACKDLRWDWRWSCCSGSRILVLNELLRTIYFNDTKNLYVNLFTNSSVNFKKGGNNITLTQQSDFPENGKINFTLSMDKGENFAVKIRKPEWLTKQPILKVNGEFTAVTVDSFGWISIRKDWKDGDEIELTLPMELGISKIEAQFDYGPDGIWAVNYGPVVLAAELNGSVKPEDVLTGSAPIKDQLKSINTPLTFEAKENNAIVFKPFYKYQRNEWYFLYMKLYKYDLF